MYHYTIPSREKMWKCLTRRQTEPQTNRAGVIEQWVKGFDIPPPSSCASGRAVATQRSTGGGKMVLVRRDFPHPDQNRGCYGPLRRLFYPATVRFIAKKLDIAHPDR
jgi:hypothetical protein